MTTVQWHHVMKYWLKSLQQCRISYSSFSISD